MLNHVELGKFLRQKRKEKGYTLDMVAGIIMMSDRELSNIERGKSIPQLGTSLMLFDLYGIPFAEFDLFYSREYLLGHLVQIVLPKTPKEPADEKKRGLNIMEKWDDCKFRYATLACHIEGVVRYGIACIEDSDQTLSILASVVDVTSDEALIGRLTDLLNRMRVSPEHLQDVVNDFLVDPAMIPVDQE